MYCEWALEAFVELASIQEPKVIVIHRGLALIQAADQLWPHASKVSCSFLIRASPIDSETKSSVHDD